MNAIERLREYVNELFYSPEGLPVSSEHECVLADVAAVDALYQAAKRICDTYQLPALAAAVRRVEGEA